MLVPVPLLLTLATTALPLQAARGGQPPRNATAAHLQEGWRWRHLDPQHLLPPVLLLTATADGRQVLVLTTDGLHRYDGYGWQTLGGTLPCPVLQVREILAGREDLLLLTLGGVFLLGPEGDFRILARTEEGALRPRATRDRRGRLLLALGATIHEIRDGTLQPVTSAPEGAGILALAAGEDDLLWCVTEQGCFRVQDGTWQRIAPPSLGPGSQRFGRILPLEGDRALFLVPRGALAREALLVGPGGTERFPYASRKTRVPTAALLDGETCFLATVHEGVLLLEGTRVTPVGWLPVDEALLTAATRVGRHLVVVTGGGDILACDLDSRRWELYPPPSPEPGLGTVNALARSTDGGLWVGTAGGLLRLPPGGRVLEPVSGPPLQGITSVHEDTTGRLWVAGGAGFVGVWEMTGGKWTLHQEEEGVGRHYVHAIRPAPDGSLWFLLLGTEIQTLEGGGIAIYADGRWEHRRPQAAKRMPRVYDVIFPGPSAPPLVATDKGVFRHVHGGWEALEPRGPRACFTLHTDRDGALWVGAGFRGMGLWRLLEGRWQEVGHPGMRAGNATDFAEDGAGRLWLPSPHGLYLWRNGRLLHAGTEPGAPAHNFWPVLARENGCWLGSLGQGLVSFEADDEEPPRILELVALPDSARNGVDIQWVARDWWEETPMDHLAYEVRVDGGPWREVQGARSLFLPAPRPGAHRVEIRALDHLGNVSPTLRSAEFTVPRPFLARPEGMAVLGALGLAVLALGYTGWRRRQDRERRQQLLAESERYFRSLVESADLVLTHYDREGRLVYASPQVEGLTGYRPSDFLADPELGDRLILPADRPANQRLRAMRGEGRLETRTIQFRLRDRQGRIRHVVERQSPRLDAEGRLQGYDAVAVDITELQDLRTALARSEERFRRIVETLQEGIWILDEAGRTVYANRQMAAILGLPKGEALQDRHLEDFLPEGGGEAITRVLEQARRGQPGRCEATLRNAAGDTVWVLLGIGPLPPQAGAGFVITCADVTEERRAREALLQTQKLESLGVLAGGIAHDFNNLLVAVLGNACLLREDMPEDSPQGALLAEIEEAANRAADLCRQMLAYAGRASTERGILDLSEVVQSMLRLLQVAMPKHVELVLELDREPVLVEGDATQLRQIVMNLVGNAAEAIGEARGRVRVATCRRCLDRTALDGLFGGQKLGPGWYALLDVEDDGCGMDAATLERIFEPFFSTRFPGRGLGLASVLGIVRAHGGAVGVRSAPGEGTLFYVVLPAAAVPQAGGGGGPEGGAVATGGR